MPACFERLPCITESLQWLHCSPKKQSIASPGLAVWPQTEKTCMSWSWSSMPLEMYACGLSCHNMFLRPCQSQLACKVMKKCKCETVYFTCSHTYLSRDGKKPAFRWGHRLPRESNKGPSSLSGLPSCQMYHLPANMGSIIKNIGQLLLCWPPTPSSHQNMRGFSGWYTFVLISRASRHHYSFLGKDGALLWDEGWSLFLILSSVTDE